jgi:RNA polymerase sigma-70 factor (ECF subfamily)
MRMHDSATKEWFVRSVQEMRHAMFRVAYAILGSEKDCEDAAAGAILSAYRRLDQLRDRHKFRAWLMRILRNECIDILRSRRDCAPLDEQIAAPEPAYAELYQAIMRLKEEQRSCVVLHYLEGFRVDEIAGIMGIPAGTVKSHLFRARLALKQALGEEDEA